jgi:hypothetical protein
VIDEGVKRHNGLHMLLAWFQWAVVAGSMTWLARGLDRYRLLEAGSTSTSRQSVAAWLQRGASDTSMRSL